MVNIFQTLFCQSYISELNKARGIIAGFELELEKLRLELAKLRRPDNGFEIPSPADIIPKGNIKVENFYNAVQLRIDYMNINIPFTKPPKLLSIMDIPDTNSMDGLMDYGNNPLYIQPADEDNRQIMVDWIARTWLHSGGLDTCDCVYRMMADPNDNPQDFTKPALWYAIHRLVNVEVTPDGRYFTFRGVNNAVNDPFKAWDSNILFLNTGVIY